MPIDRTLPHTLWYWVDDPKDPIPAPYSAQFDNADDAEEAGQKVITNSRVSWAKVFRTGNESYETWRWDRKPKEDLPVPISGIDSTIEVLTEDVTTLTLRFFLDQIESIEMFDQAWKQMVHGAYDTMRKVAEARKK